MADDNALLSIVKAARIRGKTYMEIEAMYRIPAPQAEAMINAHYSTMTFNPVEYRLLQMERLEGLIDVLYSMAQMGNIKSAEILLKTMSQISELLGLNMQTTKVEIEIIDSRQAEAFFQVISRQNEDLLALVQTMFKAYPKLLASIEDVWEEEAAKSYSKRIGEIAAVVVE